MNTQINQIPDNTHNIISINSNDLVNNMFILNEEIEATNIKIQEVIIPFTYYIINDRNNKLYFIEGSTAFNITLTNGNFDSTTIANEIQTKLIANSPASNTYVVVVNSITGKLFISNTSSNTFSLQLAGKTDVAFKILGLQAINTTPSTNYMFPRPCNLSGSQIVYVCSSILGNKLSRGKHLNSRFNRSDILDSVIVNCNPFETITWINQTFRYQTFSRKVLLESFDVYFMDEDFNVLDFNGVNSHIKFAFY